jgi:hypothetical protein
MVLAVFISLLQAVSHCTIDASTSSMPKQGHDDTQTVFAMSPMAGEWGTAADTLDLGHGPIKQRRLQTRDLLIGEYAGPDIQPLWRPAGLQL